VHCPGQLGSVISSDTSAAFSLSETKAMKRKRLLAVLAGVAIAAGLWAQPSRAEIGVTISIGDRPYYYGPSYWDAGYEWIWVPGYDRHGHWVHGHYQKRGKFHKDHAKDHRPRHHRGDNH